MRHETGRPLQGMKFQLNHPSNACHCSFQRYCNLELTLELLFPLPDVYFDSRVHVSAIFLMKKLSSFVLLISMLEVK